MSSPRRKGAKRPSKSGSAPRASASRASSRGPGPGSKQSGAGSKNRSSSKNRSGSKNRTGFKADGRPGPRPTAGTGRRSGTAKKPKGLGGTQVEGRQAVRELLLAGRRRVREIFLGNEVERADIVEDIVNLAAELRVPLHGVSRSKLDQLAHTEAPQGVVALAEQIPGEELSHLCRPVDGKAAFLLAVDGVTDPGNLGALLRIAECAGVTGVVLPRHRAVHVTPTVAKSAAGAIEYLPMSLVGGMATAVQQMREAGVWVVGLDMAGETSIHDVAVGAEPVCLVVGAESSGISRLVASRCDVIASIPLHGRLASLNVASAGAVACYELARRRAVSS